MEKKCVYNTYLKSCKTIALLTDIRTKIYRDRAMLENNSQGYNLQVQLSSPNGQPSLKYRTACNGNGMVQKRRSESDRKKMARNEIIINIQVMNKDLKDMQNCTLAIYFCKKSFLRICNTSLTWYKILTKITS